MPDVAVGPSAAPDRLTVNKRELAQLIACSAPTVDALVARHGDRFPVIERGGLGREWRFDPDAVIAFLREIEAERRRSAEAREAELLQYTLPVEGLREAHPAGMRPRDLLDTLKVQRLQRDLAREEGFLVETAEVRRVFGAQMARFNAELHAAIRQAGRELNLPDPVMRRLDLTIAEAQRRFVRSVAQFSVDAQPQSLFDAPRADAAAA